MIKTIGVCITAVAFNLMLYTLAEKIGSKEDKAVNVFAVATADMTVIILMLLDSGVIG